MLAQHPHVTNTRDGFWRLRPERRQQLQQAEGLRARHEGPPSKRIDRSAGEASRGRSGSTSNSERGDADPETSLIDVIKEAFGSLDVMTTEEIRVALARLGRPVKSDEVRRAMFDSVRVTSWGHDHWRWNHRAEGLFLAARARRIETEQDDSLLGPRIPAGEGPPTLAGKRRPAPNTSHSKSASNMLEAAQQGLSPGDAAFLGRVRFMVAPTAIDGMTCAYCLRPFIGGMCRCDAA
jgi:hypothetical protein